MSDIEEAIAFKDMMHNCDVPLHFKPYKHLAQRITPEQIEKLRIGIVEESSNE